MEKNKKQRVILDTDMGVDCDDAVALAILLNKQIAKELEILCVTTSTTRSGAVSTVRAIAEYYGESVTVGAMAKPALGCDKLNNYSAAVMEKYGAPDGACEAVKLLRKTLAEAKEKITLVAIGPLVNLARLLKSEADEISALGGVELLERSVEEIFCMGGSFAQNFGENPETVGAIFYPPLPRESGVCAVGSGRGSLYGNEKRRKPRVVFYAALRRKRRLRSESFSPDELGPRYLSLRNGKLRKILRLFLIGKNNDS